MVRKKKKKLSQAVSSITHSKRIAQNVYITMCKIFKYNGTTVHNGASRS